MIKFIFDICYKSFLWAMFRDILISPLKIRLISAKYTFGWEGD